MTDMLALQIETPPPFPYAKTKAIEETYKDLAAEVGYQYNRVSILGGDAISAQLRAFAMQLDGRTSRLAKTVPAKLLGELSGMVFAWRDIARMVNVTVPAVRRWRNGETPSGENRRQITQFLAFSQIIRDDHLVFASWMEVPVAGAARLPRPICTKTVVCAYDVEITSPEPDCEIGRSSVGVQVTTPLNRSTSAFVQTADLLARAAEIDLAVTDRTLEFWRHQGLLPGPRRSGQNGKTPLWTYPTEAVDQPRALVRLRERRKDSNILRAALWSEGNSIEASGVRRSISTFLSQMQEICERELVKRLFGANDHDARWEAIRSVAKVLAGKRGKGLPGLTRQALSERIGAIVLTLGLVLGDEQPKQHLMLDASAVERLIRVGRGRRFRPNGARPRLDGPPAEGLEGFARFGKFPLTDSGTPIAAATPHGSNYFDEENS